MTPLELKLREYQLHAGQWAERARALELQAKEATRQAELLQQRIAGINEALELLTQPKQVVVDESAVPLTIPAPQVRKRQRSLTGHWQQIMQLVDGQGTFGYEELAQAAELTGHEVGRDTLRSQMSLYKGSGLIEAVGDGQFQLTEAGRKAASIKESVPTPNEIEPPNGEPEDGPIGSDANPISPSTPNPQ